MIIPAHRADRQSEGHWRYPFRLFEKLPDGPAKGRCVDSKLWPQMKDLYYDLLGWDNETGNPKAGRLKELGLEWAL